VRPGARCGASLRGAELRRRRRGRDSGRSGTSGRCAADLERFARGRTLSIGRRFNSYDGISAVSRWRGSGFQLGMLWESSCPYLTPHPCRALMYRRATLTCRVCEGACRTWREICSSQDRNRAMEALLLPALSEPRIRSPVASCRYAADRARRFEEAETQLDARKVLASMTILAGTPARLRGHAAEFYAGSRQ